MTASSKWVRTKENINCDEDLRLLKEDESQGGRWDLEFVGVPGDEYVHIQTPLQERQRFQVTPGDHLVTVAEADLEAANLQDLRFRMKQIRAGQARCEEGTPLAFFMIHDKS